MSSVNFLGQTISGNTIQINNGTVQTITSPFYPSRDVSNIRGNDEYHASGEQIQGFVGNGSQTVWTVDNNVVNVISVTVGGTARAFTRSGRAFTITPAVASGDVIVIRYGVTTNISFTSGATVVFGRPSLRAGQTATLTSENGPYRYNTTTNAWEMNPNNIVDYDYSADQIVDIQERVIIRISSAVAQLSMFTGDNTCRPIFYGVDFLFDNTGAPGTTSFNWLGATNASAPANVEAAPSFYNCRMIKDDGNRGDFRWFGENYLIKGFEHVATNSSADSTGTGSLYEVGIPPKEAPVGFEISAPSYQSFGQRVALPFYRNTPPSTDRYAFNGLVINNFSGYTGDFPDSTAVLQRKSHQRGVTLINSSSRAPIAYTTDNATPVNEGNTTTASTSPTLPIILSAKDLQIANSVTFQKALGAGTLNAFQRVNITMPEPGFTVRVKRTAVRSYEHRGTFTNSLSGFVAGTVAYIDSGGTIRRGNGVLHRTGTGSTAVFTATGESSTETFGNGQRITTALTIPSRMTTPATGGDLNDSRLNTGTFEPVNDTTLNQQAVDETVMSDGAIAWQGLDITAAAATQIIYLPTYWQGLFNGIGNPVPVFFFRYELWVENPGYITDDTVRVFDFRPEASTNDLNRPYREGTGLDVNLTIFEGIDQAFTMPRDITSAGTPITELTELYDSLKVFSNTRGVAAYNDARLNTQTTLFENNLSGYINLGSRTIASTSSTSAPIVTANDSTVTVRWGTLGPGSFNATTTLENVLGVATTGSVDLVTSGLSGTNMSFDGATLTNVYGTAVDGISPFRLQGGGHVTSGTTVNFGTVTGNIRVRVNGYNLSDATLTRSGTGTVTLSVENGGMIPSSLPAGFAAETDTTLSNSLPVPVAYAIARNTGGTLSVVRSGVIPAAQDDGTPETVQFNNSTYQSGNNLRIRFSATGYVENTSQNNDSTFNNVLLTQSQTFNTVDHLTLDLNYTAPTAALPGTRNSLSITSAILGTRDQSGNRTIEIGIVTDDAGTVENFTYQLSDFNQLIDTGTRLGIEFREGTAGGLSNVATVQAFHAIKGTAHYALACLHNNMINILAAQDSTTAVMDDRYVIWVPQGFNAGHYFTGVGRAPAAAATSLGTAPLLGLDASTTNTTGDPSALRSGRTNTSPPEDILVPIANRPAIAGISSSVFSAGLRQVTTAIDASEADIIQSIEDNAL